MSEPSCPDDDLIDRFVAKTASEEELARVRDHLPLCPVCRRLVSALVKDLVATAPLDATEVEDTALVRGMQLGRYIVLDVIGSGAMGVVYAAYDPKLDRKVAIKVLHPGASTADKTMLRDRLMREAQAMARLAHPNVVAIHDVGESGDRVYIAMDLVDGQSLRAWLEDEPRPWREVLDAYIQAGRGLAAAHRAGMVHRDFKPDNVLLSKDGRVLVTDFGLVHVDPSEPAHPPVSSSLTLTQTGALLGTPAYMAPEQMAGRPADQRSDVYAYAVAVWQGLVGTHPYATDSLASLRASSEHHRVREPMRTAVPTRVRRALRQALNPDPAARPQHLEALLTELAADPRKQALRLSLAVVAITALILLGAAVRAVFVARAHTAEARRRAELGQRLGREVEQMELGLRAERLLPIHDLRPAEKRVRDKLAEIRGLLTGDEAADGPVHDALGRGLSALGELDPARLELETAVRAGVRDPDLNFALGDVLLRQHRAAVEEALRMGGPTWLKQRRAALEALYLPRARLHLELARGTTMAAPALLEALLAFQRGDLDAALRAAQAVARERPLYYEGKILVGKILEARGQAAIDAGDFEGGDRWRKAAIEALEAAANVGRSDAAIYEALARVWTSRLDANRGLGYLALPLGLLATDRGVTVSPDRAPAYQQRALLYVLASDSGVAVARHYYVGCAAAAREAMRLSPRDSLILDTWANCLSVKAQQDYLDGLDGTAVLEEATRALALAREISPGFPWAANDQCVIEMWASDNDKLVGRDGAGHARAARDACVEAIELDPTYDKPPANLPYVYDFILASGAQQGFWDERAQAEAHGYALRSWDMHPINPFIAGLNYASVLNTKLKFQLAMGQDTSVLRAQLASWLEALAKNVPAEWAREDAGLQVHEQVAEAALRTGDLAEARKHLDFCLETEPLRFNCTLLLIEVEQATGGRAALLRALELARGLAAKVPRSALPLVAEAETRLRLGQVAPGLATAARALELVPELAAAHAVMGRLEHIVADGLPDGPARRAALGRALADLERGIALAPVKARHLGAERRAVIEALATAR